MRINGKLLSEAYAIRFNRSLTLRPGRRRFQSPSGSVAQAPADREMDMTRITNLNLFAVDTEDIIRNPGAIWLVKQREDAD